MHVHEARKVLRSTVFLLRYFGINFSATGSRVQPVSELIELVPGRTTCGRSATSGWVRKMRQLARSRSLASARRQQQRFGALTIMTQQKRRV